MSPRERARERKAKQRIATQPRRKRSPLGRGFIKATLEPGQPAPWCRSDPTPHEHGTGDVMREQLARSSMAGAALALLEEATRMASEARSRLILAGAMVTDPAVVTSAQMVSAGTKAAEGARRVLRTVQR